MYPCASPNSRDMPYFRIVAKPQGRRAKRFPWLLLLALLGSIYVFWVLPRQIGPRRVKAEFESASTQTK
jgi:hypothetical protein